ncbi:MAG: outer membrane protein assembly factor BamA [Pseudomonadales bacterium]|nr:outer membrane protein assembly factor BamA [Pseudomonadales bacterium]
MKFPRFISVVSLLFCALIFPKFAAAFVVSDIRVEGLQRVSAGTVFSALPIEVGDDVDSVLLAEANRSLFKTGYFDQIQIGRDGDVLVVRVDERPTIAQLTFEGNEAIQTEQLQDGLKQSGLAEGLIFKRAVLEKIQLELTRQYISQGRYGVEVEAKAEQLSRNRVEITINVVEGEVAKIKKINIIGNSVYPEDILLRQFELEATGTITFLSDDQYSREKLSGDLERLKTFYLDNGYIKFEMLSVQVALTPDRKNVFITISIKEGAQYTVSDYRISGDLVVPADELAPFVVTKPYSVFSRKMMNASTEGMSIRLGNDGYAFANVNGIPEIDDENNLVSIVYMIDPGKRTYVNRINFYGNVGTQDQVLRREMVQMEGALASTFRIEHSKIRLERLGFFKDIRIETVPVPGTSDQIDVNYTVEEQPSGSIGASIGFGGGTGVIFGANLSQSNFIGTGNTVSFNVSRSDFQDSYSFSFFDPYFTVNGVSRGFSLFFKQTDFLAGNVSDYITDIFGASLRFGYPIDDITRLGFEIRAENQTIHTGLYPAQEISSFLNENGNQFHTNSTSFSWTRSTLNGGVLANRGAKNRLSVQVTLPGTDVNFIVASYIGEKYFRLTDGYLMRLRTRLAYGEGLGGEEYPFYENFYAGGFGSVRGYRDNTLGPKSTPAELDPFKTSDAFGGNILVEGSTELIFELPFIEDHSSFRSLVYLDGGNVFDSARGYDVSVRGLRFSVGVSVIWVTAMAPLTFSLGKALNPSPGDFPERFQFTLGTGF